MAALTALLATASCSRDASSQAAADPEAAGSARRRIPAQESPPPPSPVASDSATAVDGQPVTLSVKGAQFHIPADVLSPGTEVKLEIVSVADTDLTEFLEPKERLVSEVYSFTRSGTGLSPPGDDIRFELEVEHTIAGLAFRSVVEGEPSGHGKRRRWITSMIGRGHDPSNIAFPLARVPQSMMLVAVSR